MKRDPEQASFGRGVDGEIQHRRGLHHAVDDPLHFACAFSRTRMSSPPDERHADRLREAGDDGGDGQVRVEHGRHGGLALEGTRRQREPSCAGDDPAGHISACRATPHARSHRGQLSVEMSCVPPRSLPQSSMTLRSARTAGGGKHARRADRRERRRAACCTRWASRNARQLCRATFGRSFFARMKRTCNRVRLTETEMDSATCKSEQSCGH